MRARILILALCASVLLAAPAQARLSTGHALERAARHLTLSATTCPAGVPVQTITVVNQARARAWTLVRVERAMVDQSMQLRAAWGTPCVQFGPGGWPLYLRFGGGSDHYTDPLVIHVANYGLPYQAWSSSFSHEVVETLVDPSTVNSYGTGPSGGNIEVADPVEDRAYRLDGVWVSDFVLPNWYAGAHFGNCAAIIGGYTCGGPMIALDESAGPYDEMRLLSAPWQTR